MKKVLLVNWDGYPNFAVGGIYIWQKNMIERMTDHEFVVVNVLSNSNTGGSYTLPKNVSQVFEIPLFGLYRYEEFAKENRPLMANAFRTGDAVVKEKFLPLYRRFLHNITSDTCNFWELSDAVYNMHNFLLDHDLKKCIEHPLTWEIFLDEISEDPLYQNMRLNEALHAFQSFQRYMQIFALDLPKVDLVHCSQAWLPSLISIYAKAQNNCPVIVTEHGVALREVLLHYNGTIKDIPSNVFWNRIATNIVKAVYEVADVIAPVCNANGKWAQNLGVSESKIQVVYNGVDVERFKPREKKKEEPKKDDKENPNVEEHRPTVAYLGRIDPWKDIVNLIYSMDYVKQHVTEVQCLIYGSANNLDYAVKCVKTVKEMHLENTVKFMGHTSKPEEVYNQADVIVTSSVAEGFPLWLLEAMASGKGIVATNVGGIQEALEGCGMLVRPSRPLELGNAVVQLLRNDTLRKNFGDAAKEKVLKSFTLDRSVAQFHKLYSRLTSKRRKKSFIRQIVKRRLSV